jgi:heme exporter protein D
MLEVFTGEHGGYILGSYVAAVLIMGGLIAWVLIDGKQVRQKLAALEAAGIRRASSQSKTSRTSGPKA